MNAKTTKSGIFTRHRTLIIVLGLILFLPPLAFIFQVTTGDSSFCGRWCPRMFLIWREGMTGGQFVAGIVRSIMGAALVVGVLVSTVFLGRYWCSHLCPIGGTTELGSRLIPKFLKIDFSSVPAASVRYGYLSVYFIAPLVGLGSLCCNYCNFAIIPRIFGAAFSQADLLYFFRAYGLINLGMIVVLGFLSKGGRGYCNMFCPIGALDAIASRLGARFGKRMRVIEGRCNNCGLCKDVCPTWAINVKDVAHIDQLSCFPCRLCEGACPKSAIAYGKTSAELTVHGAERILPAEAN